MAEGTGVGDVFKNDSQLQGFWLNGVTSTGRALGTGAYCSMVEVSLASPCCGIY